jgi:polar amino acid transport system permease protein
MDSVIDLVGQIVPSLLRGMRVTLELTVVAAVLALFMAFLAGIARLSKNPIPRVLSGIYVEVFRGTSALVQLFWIFFALPFLGITLQPFTAGVLALGLNVGAYGSEVVRGAIVSIPKGQTEASIALNLSWWQRMRYVIVPQAWLRMLPPFGNQIVELLKVTALVSLVTLQDMTYEAQMFTQTRGHTTAVYTVLLILYFLLAYPFASLVRWVERKSRWVGYGEARR